MKWCFLLIRTDLSCATFSSVVLYYSFYLLTCPGMKSTKMNLNCIYLLPWVRKYCQSVIRSRLERDFFLTFWSFYHLKFGEACFCCIVLVTNQSPLWLRCVASGCGIQCNAFSACMKGKVYFLRTLPITPGSENFSLLSCVCVCICISTLKSILGFVDGIV